MYEYVRKCVLKVGWRGGSVKLVRKCFKRGIIDWLARIIRCGAPFPGGPEDVVDGMVGRLL